MSLPSMAIAPSCSRSKTGCRSGFVACSFPARDYAAANGGAILFAALQVRTAVAPGHHRQLSRLAHGFGTVSRSAICSTRSNADGYCTSTCIVTWRYLCFAAQASGQRVVVVMSRFRAHAPPPRRLRPFRTGTHGRSRSRHWGRTCVRSALTPALSGRAGISARCRAPRPSSSAIKMAQGTDAPPSTPVTRWSISLMSTQRLAPHSWRFGKLRPD